MPTPEEFSAADTYAQLRMVEISSGVVGDNLGKMKKQILGDEPFDGYKFSLACELVAKHLQVLRNSLGTPGLESIEKQTMAMYVDSTELYRTFLNESRDHEFDPALCNP